MSGIDLDMPPEPVIDTQVLRGPVTDKPTRERSEHPDRNPREAIVHPSTRVGRRRERIGAG